MRQKGKEKKNKETLRKLGDDPRGVVLTTLHLQIISKKERGKNRA